MWPLRKANKNKIKVSTAPGHKGHCSEGQSFPTFVCCVGKLRQQRSIYTHFYYSMCYISNPKLRKILVNYKFYLIMATSGIRAVKSNWFWFNSIFDWQRAKTFRFDSISIQYWFDSKTIRFDTKTASAVMKEFGHLEVGQFYKGIVHQDGKNILESLLWWHSVNSSFSTIMLRVFLVQLSVQIK